MKRAAADPWDQEAANRRDCGADDRGATTHTSGISASGFAAGPVRKPGAAHLVNWFYELPPYVYDSSLLEGKTRYPLGINRSATTLCARSIFESRRNFCAAIKRLANGILRV